MLELFFILKPLMISNDIFHYITRNNSCFREWYSFHFPELFKVVPENHLYVKCVDAIQNRKEMPEDIKEKLTEILMDSDKAQNVIDLSRSSMGMLFGFYFT